MLSSLSMERSNGASRSILSDVAKVADGNHTPAVFKANYLQRIKTFLKFISQLSKASVALKTRETSTSR